jgi:hypothetical protein
VGIEGFGGGCVWVFGITWLCRCGQAGREERKGKKGVRVGGRSVCGQMVVGSMVDIFDITMDVDES